ncbi:hypothetical protein GQ457_03G045090 [Hibiscus cannabinus]
MEMGIQITEALLRLTAISLLVLTACLVGFDSQRKVIFYIDKKASFKDLRALVGLVYITSLAAAYNLVQLSCSSFSARCKTKLTAILQISSLASFYFRPGSSVRSVCRELSGNATCTFSGNRRRQLPMAQVVR